MHRLTRKCSPLIHCQLTTWLAGVVLACGALTAGTVLAQSSSRPLTLPGKTALYQRVIAVPGARLASAPDATPADAETITPFTIYYVYARSSRDGREWLQVGTDSDGRIDGWLPAEQGIAWQQALTVGFRDPASVPRVLLFRERDALKTLLADDDPTRYASLRERAAAGDTADSPVAAIQPDAYIDVRRNFYLVPILSHEDVLVDSQQSRLLRVATVPLQDASAIIDAYRAGIVFVIDSTVSMGPYIERTRATMRRVYDAIAEAQLSGRVGYGLVAYRDNLDAVPELGYATRIFAPLESASGDAFLRHTRDVRAATVSSQDFDEDAFAGVRQAIDDIDWGDYYARYVVLITDAGPRDADDPLSATGLTAGALRKLAADKDIAISVMHLRTPRGADNHDYAERQYRELTRVSGIGDLYYPVEAGDVASFEQALTTLTSQLTAQVREAASGRAPLRVAQAGADSGLAEYEQKVARLGYALRLKYLQEEGGQAVPALFNAWMVDRDPEDPDELAVDVRVMLTRDQLSDLHDVLRQVLLAAEEGALAPQDFLNELTSLAATVSRDPQAVKGATRTAGAQSLADLGYMREYLDGLPYRSEVMNLDLSAWQQWSAQQQFEFIAKLDGKIAYYRALHDNLDLWVSLDGGPIDGDSLYPLLLEALP